MNALTNGSIGKTYTIKWLLGLPNKIIDYLQQFDIAPGNTVCVVQSCRDYMIVRSGTHCVAMETGVAQQIKI